MTQQATRPDSAPGLRRNAVGLLAAIMLSATIMGPAVSTYFNTQFTAINAGAALPFVFLVSLIAALIVANGVAEMARKRPLPARSTRTWFTGSDRRPGSSPAR